MAAEVFPVARIDEYAKPYESAIHVLRSVLPGSVTRPHHFLTPEIPASKC